uniref:Uncharacterized protein n=1 Tax=Rhizophora mucronata TaxID=61149 RepID=A0A2P2LPV2_RHIMU
MSTYMQKLETLVSPSLQETVKRVMLLLKLKGQWVIWTQSIT